MNTCQCQKRSSIQGGCRADNGSGGRWASAARLCRAQALALAITIVLGLGAAAVRPALAEAPPLSLSITGPNSVQAGQPLTGITLHLVNPGDSAPDSRLRLFVHDAEDRDLHQEDITLEVREGNVWVAVPVELIDGGVMGAIGATGTGHQERHQSGGFSIAANAALNWQMRVTFRLSGNYSLVAAVSPDNGSRHLAQPVSFSLEAL